MIVRSAVVQTSVVFINSLIAVLLLPYVARVLGPTALGKVDFLAAVSQSLCLLAGLGLPLYGMREVGAAVHDPLRLPTLLAELFFLNFLASVLAIAVYLPMAMLMPIMSEEPLLALVFGLHIPATLFGMEWAVSGFGAFFFLGIRSLAAKLVSSAAIILLVKAPEQYLIYGLISGALVLANQLISMIWLFKRARLTFVGMSFGRHARPLAFSFSIVLLTRFYIGLDKIMLGLLSTQRALGLYSLAERLIRVAIDLLGSLSLVLLPSLSRLFRGKKNEDANRLVAINLSISLYVCGVVLLIGFLYSDPLLPFVLGPAFRDTVPVFQMGLGVLLCVSLARIWGIHLLYAAGLEKRYLASVLVAGLLAVLLNSLLIPRFAERGAMFATLLAEASGLFMQIFLVGKRSWYILRQAAVWKACALGLVITGLSVAAQMFGIAWFSPYGFGLAGLLLLPFVLALIRQLGSIRQVFSIIEFGSE